MSRSFVDPLSDSFSDSDDDLFDKSLPLSSDVFSPSLTLPCVFSGHLQELPSQHTKTPTDISIVPDNLAAYLDDTIDQSSILNEIIGTSLCNQSSEERFNNMPIKSLKLSSLRDYYEKDDPNVVNLLSTRHKLVIDDEFKVPLGNGQVNMNTDESMIDYHLTVANCIGFSSLLTNSRSNHRFDFEMDLKKPYRSFKGKHAMLGFDPAGSMLFIGHCENEEVFLAMAPNEFLHGHTQPSPPGHSSASPLMSKRHYRQMVMMIVHFLALIPQRSYYTMDSVYDQDLDSSNPAFEKITDCLYVFLFFTSLASCHVIPFHTLSCAHGIFVFGIIVPPSYSFTYITFLSVAIWTTV